MATRRLGTRPPQALSAEQKFAFVLLMFLGFGGIFFGFRSFGANLMRPIEQQIAELYTGESFLSSDERQAAALEESKSKDTDGDGLVDYDELYVYKTSPYVSDSDSDGYDDKMEVFSGNNPNCPEGKDCGSFVSSSEVVGVSGASIEALVGSLGSEGLLEAGAVPFESAEDVEAFFKTATLDEIRASLLEAGMSQEELDLIDDETLEAYFIGVLEEAAAQGELDALVETSEE
ncbi:hypothetical protein HY631_01895 [Candidatus Uhrbacteria bacterium]|nr:hypothetical protein [Candidatus Uhrbacteria bacterium]